MGGGAIDADSRPAAQNLEFFPRLREGKGVYQTMLETSRRTGENAVNGGGVLAQNNSDLRDELCTGPQRHPHLLSELMEHGHVSWEFGSRRKSSRSGNFAAANTKSSLHLPLNGQEKTCTA